MSSTIAPTTSSASVTPLPGGAAAAIGGALLLAVCNVLSALAPQTGTTRDTIAWFGENPGLAEAVSATGLLAALLLVPGIWAAVQRLRGVVAGVGGWLMGSGYLLSTVLSFETLTVSAILAAGGDPGLLAVASDAHAPTTAFAVYVLFGLGALVGTLLLGIAMLRSGVPSWAGWAMIASVPVRMIGLLTGLTLVGPPLASLLIAVGFAGVFVARRR
ncbi:hypothetical protein [Pseudonocardia oroxyli]|uniref:DUF4386 family protein n=1 Tax=Pseudonocardia oroxyli TaxID=366584 RepID=A0A1G7RVL8_PSEOR|nr:hypothetical protein [Pseudonocardia oroxyli]SDG14778.1 hypothetical protein SAMN05216377_109154 [Pseudonocardia oroxyli]